MSHPQQINPARSTVQETELERWDRSQRGRRYADLDERRKHGALTPLQRDAYRTLAAERRAIIAEPLGGERSAGRRERAADAGRQAVKPSREKKLMPPVRRDAEGFVRCRVCHCTDREPCEPPCAWSDYDLCSSCALVAEAIVNWSEAAHHANLSALLREVLARRKAAGA